MVVGKLTIYLQVVSDRSRVGIGDPTLGELVADGPAEGCLQFEVDARAAVADAEAVFLCLPNPADASGAADLSEVESVTADITLRCRRGAPWSSNQPSHLALRRKWQPYSARHGCLEPRSSSAKAAP